MINLSTLLLRQEPPSSLVIWDYRLLDDNPIPDSLRYRVLMDAKGHCAFCGATREETVLDVDHIIPRSKDGKTVYENLQVLCSKCNRTKQDKDDTDFRELAATYQVECLFCETGDDKKIYENDLAYVILDNHPITPRSFSDHPQTSFYGLL